MVERVDVHQHIWTPSLLEALAARDRLPFIRRTDGIAVLHCAGEQAWSIDLEAESPERRTALIAKDGLDLALIALSSPIGIEALCRDEACELIEAHLIGVEALSPQFAAWGPVALDQPDPGGVDALLARGCVGITLPAGALGGPDGLSELAPLLARAEALGAPVFVHPRAGPDHAPARVLAHRAAVVGSPDRLRGPDAGGVADLHHNGPARAPRPTRPVRDAGRRRAAARRSAGRAAAPGLSCAIRLRSMRPRATGRPRSRSLHGGWGRTSSSMAPIDRVIEPAATQ